MSLNLSGDEVTVSPYRLEEVMKGKIEDAL